jgi:hypothetical protein
MTDTNREIVRIQGHVVSETVKRGTASEHVGVVLVTPAGERFLLVRLGGNPFNDRETRRLVGREVEVAGYIIGSELRYVEAREKGSAN